MTPDSAKCAKSAKCFNYARGSGEVFFALDGVKISRLGASVRLEHFADFADFARVAPDLPPAPRPPPPSPPAADDEPPSGHPAWDRPPVEEPDGRWEPADVVWDAQVPVPFTSCDVPALHFRGPAYSDPGGGVALLCPYCARRHFHGGLGHRLAHCDDPRGRGYVLIEAKTVPPWTVPPSRPVAPDRELQR